jgi:antitoxin CptB
MPSPERVRRLRWRARRGLLENDIVLGRYLDAHVETMSESAIEALDRLLDLSDPELLDLILRRREPEGDLDTPAVRALVEALRAA